MFNNRFFFYFFFLLIRRPLISTLFPYTTLFRSSPRPGAARLHVAIAGSGEGAGRQSGQAGPTAASAAAAAACLPGLPPAWEAVVAPPKALRRPERPAVTLARDCRGVALGQPTRHSRTMSRHSRRKGLVKY